MRKFKMPDSFSILFIIIILIGMLTWVVPSGEYVNICDNGLKTVVIDEVEVCPVSQEAYSQILIDMDSENEISDTLYTQDMQYQYNQIDQNKQGLWQILNAPITGFYEAVDIALFVMIIGGFLSIVIATGAMDAAMNVLLSSFKGKEKYLIPILMSLFALGGSTYGMSEETIAFYALIIPVFLIAGYDTVVGVMVIMLGAGIGVLGSTVNPFAVGVASDAAGLSMGDGFIPRVIFFIIVTFSAIFFTMRYAKKVKGDIKNSIVYDKHEEMYQKMVGNTNEKIELTKSRIVIMIVFIMTFVLMVASVIPWTNFNIYIFENINNIINDKFIVLSGTQGQLEFGSWWFGELSMLFMSSSIIIGVIAAKSNLLKTQFIDEFIKGSKDLLSVALVIGLARGIYIIMSSSGMDATLLNFGSEMLKGFGSITYIIGSFIFYLPMSFLIPSTSGLANATIPVMAPLGEMVYGSQAGSIQTITSFVAASGIVNLITPTSGVVMGGLAIANIGYDRWVKHLFKYIVFLCILSILYLSILAILA